MSWFEWSRKRHDDRHGDVPVDSRQLSCIVRADEEFNRSIKIQRIGILVSHPLKAIVFYEISLRLAS